MDLQAFIRQVAGKTWFGNQFKICVSVDHRKHRRIQSVILEHACTCTHAHTHTHTHTHTPPPYPHIYTTTAMSPFPRLSYIPLLPTWKPNITTKLHELYEQTQYRVLPPHDFILHWSLLIALVYEQGLSAVFCSHNSEVAAQWGGD